MGAEEDEKNSRSSKPFNKKVDQFRTEVNEAADRLQKEFGEKFEELKQAGEKLKKEAENKERWKEVETNLKKAADDVGNAFKAAFKSREKKKH